MESRKQVLEPVLENRNNGFLRSWQWGQTTFENTQRGRPDIKRVTN